MISVLRGKLEYSCQSAGKTAFGLRNKGAELSFYHWSLSKANDVHYHCVSFFRFLTAKPRYRLKELL